jgi:hypothetical protein
MDKSQPYHARLEKFNLIRTQGGKSIFKVYYLSITGRDDPEKYEWESSPFSREEFEEIFLSKKIEGIGFVISFPHITKVFLFSQPVETNLDVSVFQTRNMDLVGGSLEPGWQEFACYAESVIAAQEFDAWAKATRVEEYLDFRCARVEFDIQNHGKMGIFYHD